MTKEIDWKAVEEHWGDGSFESNRSIARKYGITETAIRKKSKQQNWPRDRVRAQIEVMRRTMNAQLDLLELEIDLRLAMTDVALRTDAGYANDPE